MISAGEFFELLRPAALVLAMLPSIWVLANARRRGFRLYAGLAWALGTFFLPFVVLPLYLIVLILRHSATARLRSTDENRSEPNTESRALVVKYRLLLPAAYGIVLFGVTGVYLYRDYRSVDAHLARATQAKLVSQPAKTIREYRAALALEDNPHTHKLLGLELADTKQWGEALKEFRLAERGGEPDESLPFREAQALSARGEHVEAVVEYQRFLKSHACVQALPDERCEAARKALENSR